MVHINQVQIKTKKNYPLPVGKYSLSPIRNMINQDITWIPCNSAKDAHFKIYKNLNKHTKVRQNLYHFYLDIVAKTEPQKCVKTQSW